MQQNILTPNQFGLKPNLNTVENILHLVIYLEINLDEVSYITETTLTIRGTRRRTTVPKNIVDKLKLQNGDKIRWILFKNDNISISKVK